MSLAITGETSPNLHLPAASAAVAVLALTSIHHIYGAALYDTPWRLHIVYFALPAAALIAGAIYLGRALRGSMSGTIATWAGSLLALAFPVALIGFYEGGYNHLVKNLVFFGSGEDAARTLFSGEAYEMPNNFFFELSGVAQFPLAILTAVLVVRLLRSTAANGA
ncbi:MAG TPA: hypothetical protein VIZ90_09165 [Rhizobiaceae bacterium]